MYKYSWTLKEDKKLQKRRLEGKLFFEIGKEMNVCSKNVERRIVQLAYADLLKDYTTFNLSKIADSYRISYDNLKSYADYKKSKSVKFLEITKS